MGRAKLSDVSAAIKKRSSGANYLYVVFGESEKKPTNCIAANVYLVIDAIKDGAYSLVVAAFDSGFPIGVPPSTMAAVRDVKCVAIATPIASNLNP